MGRRTYKILSLLMGAALLLAPMPSARADWYDEDIYWTEPTKFTVSDMKYPERTEEFDRYDGYPKVIIIANLSGMDMFTTQAFQTTKDAKKQNPYLKAYAFDMADNTRESILSKLTEIGADERILVDSLSTNADAKRFSDMHCVYQGTAVVYISSDGEIYELEDMSFGPTPYAYQEMYEMLEKIGIQVSNESQLTLAPKRTQAQIREYVTRRGATLSDPLTYAQEPSAKAPYSVGSLSAETLQSSLAMLNQIRYIAGLEDNVVLDDSLNNYAQTAMLVCAANGILTHYPTQPADMNHDVYKIGAAGAASSNLSWRQHRASMSDIIVYGWMNDGDSGNISKVGHRRWLLNTHLGKVGFGAVSYNGTYFAVACLDCSNEDAKDVVVSWPAQNMPVEYFTANFPWTVCVPDSVTLDGSKIQVKLTRSSDGKVWNLSASSADGYFNVDNDAYGDNNAIIFRPEVNTIPWYNAGDEYTVSVTGMPEKIGDIEYTVRFFSLKDASYDCYEPEDTTDIPEESEGSEDLSQEQLEKIKEFAARMYTEAMGRKYDMVGLLDWSRRLAIREIDGAGIAYGFIMSPEFNKKNLSDEDYVKVLYKTFFNREADSVGQEYWLGELKRGVDRGFVLRGFVESKEFGELTASYGILRGSMFDDGTPKKEGVEGFVQRIYKMALKRNEDAIGLKDWSGKIKTQVSTPVEVAKNFFFSGEFTDKHLSDEEFVETLYETFMGRGSDPEGKADWLGKLKAGTHDRGDVIDGFAGSREFADIVASFGI